MGNKFHGRYFWMITVEDERKFLQSVNYKSSSWGWECEESLHNGRLLMPRGGSSGKNNLKN